MSPSTKKFLAYLSIILITVVWGSTFILIKMSLATMGVYYFLFLRFGIATLAMALVFHKRILAVTKEGLLASLLLGIFLGLSYITQTEGLRFTTATNSGMITGLYIVLIPFASVLLFKHKVGTLPFVCAGISAVGLYLLTNYSFTGINIGDALTLICAICWVFHIIFTGRYAHKFDAISLVFYQLLLSTVLIGVIALATGEYRTAVITPIAWLTIGVTSLVATVIAFIAQVYFQRIVDPTRTGIIFALESVCAAVTAWLIGGETLSRISFIGASLMVGGMVVSESPALLRHILKKPL